MSVFKIVTKLQPVIPKKIVLIFMAVILAAIASGAAKEWQKEFDLSDRNLKPFGESRYFILNPGYQIILESKKAKLIMTVLEETRQFNGITTRVVEEREEKKGRLHEISRNFLAMDQETGDVFYFGEEVDYYDKHGNIKSHKGAWMADKAENQPGMLVPGQPLLGMRYYQEQAPGIAMDRAEVISISDSIKTPAGDFKNCLKLLETSKIKTLLIFSPREYKTYAPGIGIVQDEKLLLTRYGYVTSPNNQTIQVEDSDRWQLNTDGG